MHKTINNVKIISQDHKGRGICKIDNKPVFVEGALPNEIVDITITKEAKSYLEATVLKKIEDKSIKPICPYYKTCGGCDILHQKYEDQRKFKTKKIEEILKKFANTEIKPNPIVFAEPLHYRNKITLHNLGLYQKHSKQVTPISECKLADKAINEIIKRLEEYSQNSNNIFENIMIRSTNKGELMLDATGKISKMHFLNHFEDIDVVRVNQTNLTKKDSVCDEINGMTFKISPTSFYQVNQFVTPKLYDLVVQPFKNKKIKTALDLYCGTGTISLLVSPYVQKVIGIETVPSAIQDANENKQENNIQNVEFICGKVEENIENFKDIDAIIVDPPRAGLDQKTKMTILELEPNLIVYVSCDPVTLARDLNILKEKYELSEITPVDMFPNTYHVECVSLLYLKETAQISMKRWL